MLLLGCAHDQHEDDYAGLVNTVAFSMDPVLMLTVLESDWYSKLCVILTRTQLRRPTLFILHTCSVHVYTCLECVDLQAIDPNLGTLYFICTFLNRTTSERYDGGAVLSSAGYTSSHLNSQPMSAYPEHRQPHKLYPTQVIHLHTSHIVLQSFCRLLLNDTHCSTPWAPKHRYGRASPMWTLPPLCRVTTCCPLHRLCTHLPLNQVSALV